MTHIAVCVLDEIQTAHQQKLMLNFQKKNLQNSMIFIQFQNRNNFIIFTTSIAQSVINSLLIFVKIHQNVLIYPHRYSYLQVGLLCTHYYQFHLNSILAPLPSALHSTSISNDGSCWKLHAQRMYVYMLQINPLKLEPVERN